jgi:rRNA maturation endonuclease Nob1
MILVNCIGNGKPGSGCGKVQGKSGGTCPQCGGMLLDDKALKESEELADLLDDE